MNISTISPASNTVSANSSSSSSSDTFMTLLLAELQTQDPMSPMDTQAMVTQLSEMQMVSENRATRLSQQFSQATSLLGKTVTWQDTTNGATQTGTVSGVSRHGSEPRLTVGSATLTLDQVLNIT